MTPDEIVTYARQRYNAPDDDFFSPTELYNHIYVAQNELAQEGYVIERVYSTTTVADTQEYAWPTNAIAIKRITCDGVKLQPITFREDDALTLTNSTTTATGRPQYYAMFDRTLYLRAVPDSAYALEIFCYSMPQPVSATSTIEVPTTFHFALVDYIVWMFALKDQNHDLADRMQNKWDEAIKRARIWQRKSKRGDSYSAVQDLETLPVTVIGAL